MAEFKVEKKIPIPATKGGNHKYPFSEMEVGDSFVAAKNGSVDSSAQQYGKRHNKKFMTRSESKTTYCIWRIK